MNFRSQPQKPSSQVKTVLLLKKLSPMITHYRWELPCIRNFSNSLVFAKTLLA
jgi:hypothetical protein